MTSDVESSSMPISPGTGISSGLSVEKFRKLVKNYLERHCYQAAEFWANKLISQTNGAPMDVYYLAQCYFLTKQYHRAVLLIKSHNLTKNSTCCYLAARCLFEIEEYKPALDLIDQNISESDENSKKDILQISEIDELVSTDCSLQLLKGRIHEACDNRALACECFRKAFQADPLCYEALHALTHHHILPRKEEQSLLASLNLSQKLDPEEEIIVRTLYETQLSNYSGDQVSIPHSLNYLNNNLDVLAAQAQSLYYQCHFQQCFKLTQQILQEDPYHPDCLTIHIACLVELNHTNALFLLGHKFVDLYPEDARSWFAVGCYYYLIGKNESARRFLSKATSLDNLFGPAWIAYGHSFAAENEHDQARAAYYKAAQLIKGCHLPLLYIGMEYSLTNDPKFAERFFTEAAEIAPNDPFVQHELGVVHFTNQSYQKADKSFRQAIHSVEQSGIVLMPEKWATLLHNMGRTLAKLDQHEEALEFHKHSLRVSPGDASSYACIGICHAHCSRFQESIVALHKALALQRDNVVAANLLQTVINHVVANESTGQGDIDPLFFDSIPLDTSIPMIHNETSINTIGDPDMHSSDVLGDSGQVSPVTPPPQMGESSAQFIEDMMQKYCNDMPPTPDMPPSTPVAGEASTLQEEDMIMDDDSP